MTSFPNIICWGVYLFPIVYACLFCQRLFDHLSVSSFLSDLFCSIDNICLFCTTTILFGLLLIYLCNIVWNQEMWYLQLCFSLLWLFWVFVGFIPIQIVESFVIVLWKCHWYLDTFKDTGVSTLCFQEVWYKLGGAIL